MSKTTAEYIEIMRAAEDEMTDLDQIIVGGWVRLEVPFNSMPALRKWCDLAEGFIQTCRFYAQPRAAGDPYLSQRARLFHLRSEATQINREMRGHRGAGRTKGSKTKRYPQGANSVDNVTKIK